MSSQTAMTLVELRDATRAADARIGAYDREYHFEDLNWARQMCRPDPPSSDPALRARASRMIEQATGLPLQDGMAVLQEKESLDMRWKEAVTIAVRATAPREMVADVTAYAIRYRMLPEEAIAYITALPEHRRQAWFFGGWYAPETSA